ncbi:MAG TPA: hypothetical protein VL475_10670, partial [Planctomycetaceae bacterium]|nr:hypothetical protein [Planctomycetaceae bacterium]
MSYQVRQLGLGGILDQAVTLVKNHFGLLLAVTLVLQIPYGLAQGFVTNSSTPELPENPTQQDLVAFQQATMKSLVVTMPLLLVAAYVVLPITNAAMVYAIASAYLDKTTTVGGAFQHAFRQIFPLLWTWLLVGLCVMGGMMLCIIPGIIAAFWFGLATQVVVIEGTYGMPALKRSRELMKGNIATLFVLGLLIGAINACIVGGASIIPEKHLAVVAQVLASSITTI